MNCGKKRITVENSSLYNCEIVENVALQSRLSGNSRVFHVSSVCWIIGAGVIAD